MIVQVAVEPNPPRRIPAFTKKLEFYTQGWRQVLRNVFLARVESGTVTDLYRELASVLQPEDRILVSQVGEDEYAGLVSPESRDWVSDAQRRGDF